MIRLFSRVVAVALVGALLAADAPIRVTGQILDYEKGFVFFTSGDGFRVSPNVTILDLKSQHSSTHPPRPRDYARASFDPTGLVTEIELSPSVLPAEASFAAVQKFAVALSTPVPNPDLALPTPAPGFHGRMRTFTGVLVPVRFDVQVPPGTPLTDNVYIMTDQSGWNPQAIRMNRVDPQHFSIVRQILSGTHFKYIFTRGSLSTEELGRNRLEVQPRDFVLSDTDVKVVPNVVYGWADQNAPGGVTLPNSIPTPFNPQPFPNLPPRPPAR